MKPHPQFLLDDNLRRRFLAKTLRLENGCLLFTGSKTRDGHGKIMVRHRDGSHSMQYAHRVSLLLAGRKLKKKVEVCHKCNFSSCVEEDHLYVGNRRTNSDDVIRAGSQRGERNPMARLSDHACAAIRWLRSQGFMLADIGFLFDCRESTVSRIANGVRRRI